MTSTAVTNNSKSKKTRTSKKYEIEGNSHVSNVVVSYAKDLQSKILEHELTAAFLPHYNSLKTKVQEIAGPPIHRILVKYSRLQLLTATILILFFSLMTFWPLFRWNFWLSIYMPTMSGMFLRFSSFQWLWYAYLSFELNNFPDLFDIPEIIEMNGADFTWSKFLKASQNLREPVVVRGLFSASKMVNDAGSDEWIANYSDFEIQTIKEKVKGSFKYDYDLESENFASYIADIQKGNFGYSYGLDGIFNRYPNLISDLELERYANNDGTDFNFCQSISLFVTSGGRGLRWHNADIPNFAMQIEGHKDWHMIHPKYSIFVSPDGNDDPYATGFACNSPKEIFDQIPKNIITTRAGDALFTPTWHWHLINSFADKDSKLVILNTCRFSAIWSSFFIQPVLEFYRHAGISPYINWIHPNLPQFVKWIPFMRVWQDSFREFFGLISRWDSDYCFSSKKICDVTGNKKKF